MALAGATAATEVLSVAGPAVVSCRLPPRPMRATACGKNVPWPMLELLASKGARPVLRGGGWGNPTSLPDPPEATLDDRRVGCVCRSRRAARLPREPREPPPPHAVCRGLLRAGRAPAGRCPQ